MQLIYNKIFLQHKANSHPERPERLLAFGNLQESAIENGAKYLKLTYSANYIEKIKSYSENETWLDSDTYTNKKSYETACYAAGAAIKAAKQNDFALVRPPRASCRYKQSNGILLV